MAIKISGTTVIDNSRNINAGIGTFDQIDVPPTPLTFNPANAQTNVGLDTNITITFNQQVDKGTGNITLRNGSGIGTAIETISVGSTRVSISAATVTIDPVNVSPSSTNVYVVIDAGAFIGLSFNKLINTYSFTTTDFALQSINPANGATNVDIDTNVTLTFTNPPSKGTGTIELRSGSTSGTIIESFNVSTSSRITTSGNTFIINPTNNLGFSASIHTIIPSTAIAGYVGLNITGADAHSFTTDSPALGDSYEGGFLICKASPLRWVVSPRSAEVTRTWYLRNNANTRAQQVSGCSGWFVPTRAQLQNPGYCCRSFWGPSPCYSSSVYWSSTENGAINACSANFVTGITHNGGKDNTNCVRAFRCVTY